MPNQSTNLLQTTHAVRPSLANSACHIHIRLMTSPTANPNESQSRTQTRTVVTTHCPKPKSKLRVSESLGFSVTIPDTQGVNREANKTNMTTGSRAGQLFVQADRHSFNFYSLAASSAYYNWRCSYRCSLLLSISRSLLKLFETIPKIRKNMSKWVLRSECVSREWINALGISDRKKTNILHKKLM